MGRRQRDGLALGDNIDSVPDRTAIIRKALDQPEPVAEVQNGERVARSRKSRENFLSKVPRAFRRRTVERIE